jgi:hypothetical protein
MIYVIDDQGNELERCGTQPVTDGLRQVLQAKHPEAVLWEAAEVYQAGTTFDLSGDEPAAVPPEPPSEVWLHLSVAGGDGEDPPGAPTDGSAPLSVSAALRATQDPASAILAGVNRSYRITVRDDQGAVYDVRKITLASGEMAAVNYFGTGEPGVCEVLESDFDQVESGGTTYTVRLAQPVRFKFFGTLA